MTASSPDRPRPLRGLVAVAIFVALIASACSDDGDTTSAPESDESTTSTIQPAKLMNPYGEYTSELYADAQNWICHPDAAVDECDTDLDTTEVEPDGTATVVAHEPAADPEIDCFYVYPTVSFDENGNSDLELDVQEEIYTAVQQAARYNSVCRVFAPAYRQMTVGNIIDSLPADAEPPDPVLAQGDVVDAWKHYIANDNNGRGVLLIGHSQGAGQLAQLVSNEITGNESLGDRIVGAHLIGGLEAPDGSDTPEGFGSISACRSTDEYGCLVTYKTFREGDLPPGGEEFIGEGAICVNPAAPEGGPALLTPYYPNSGGSTLTSFVGEPVGPYADPARLSEITTPFFTTTDLVEAECVERDGSTYLEVRILADPTNPQADEINGDLAVLPSFGLHLVDMSIAMGELIDLASSQAAAYLADN